MAEKRSTPKSLKKNQRGLDDSRNADAGLSKKVLPFENHEYQCSGDFVEDYRQTIRVSGIPPEETPKIVNKKQNFSLWRNVEIPPPPPPPVTDVSQADSPTFDSASTNSKGGNAGAKNVDGSSKSSMLDAAKAREKDKSKDKGKKKASKITGGSTKTESQTAFRPAEQKTPPGPDHGLSRSAGALETSVGSKKPDRLFTSKGRRDKDSKEDSVAQLPPSPPLIEGTDQKPVYVVYEPYSHNRLKEIAIRCWTVDRLALETLYKCWIVADKLTTIILVDCGLRSTDIMQLSDVLPKILNLEFLALDGNYIVEQNHGLVLAKHSSLRSLSLRYANLDDKAMQNLADSWHFSSREWSADQPGLEFLDLSRNKITDKGLEYLIQALRFNRSLSTLAMPGNQITDYGVDLLCSVRLLDKHKNCLFSRFLLTKSELLDRRTKKMQFIPSFVGSNVYALKRRYQHSTETSSNREKLRPDEDGNEQRKKADDNKKTGSRLSGARVSAGNAIKSSGMVSGRVTRSANPVKPPQSGLKHAPSIVKSSPKQVPASASSTSHPQADAELSTLKDSGGAKLGHIAAPSKGPDASGHDVESVSHHDLASHVSIQESEISLEILAGPQDKPPQPASFVLDQDVLFNPIDSAIIRDQRIMNVIQELRKTHIGESLLTDGDIWLDRKAALIEVDPFFRDLVLVHGIEAQDFEKYNQLHKGHVVPANRTGKEYQEVLLKYCREIVSGTVYIQSLPLLIQNDLIKLCENPYFMLEHGSEGVNNLGGFVDTPKYYVHVTSASLVALDAIKSQEALKTSDQTAGFNDLDNSKGHLPAPVSPDLESHLFIADNASEASVAGSEIRTTTAVPRPVTNAGIAEVHRRMSQLKRIKPKKNDLSEAQQEPPKECPYYVVNTVEENFNTLLDGIIFEDSNRLISDGNRTIKVLNLVSNKLTPKSVYTLMETISKQREEQSAALSWQRSVSPEPSIPKPPLLPPASYGDLPEPDAAPAKKEVATPVIKHEEKVTAIKRIGLKRIPGNTDSVASALNADDASSDDCSPIILQKRVVKNKEDDPNRQNIGLMYVDVEHNQCLSKTDIPYKVFNKFLNQERSAYGLTGISSAEKQDTSMVNMAEPAVDDLFDHEEVALKKLPEANPAQYSLLKAEYVTQKKKETMK